MKILMTHFGTEVAETARSRLESAGHQVFACEEEPPTGIVCGALGGGRCPLDEQPIDVAVHVRGNSGLSESGTLCALRRFVPVVVASRGDEAQADPFLPWATAVCGVEELAEVVGPAASAPLPAHSVAAERAANALLVAEGLPPSFAACVRRRGRDLRVELTCDRDVPEPLRARSAVRAESAIRMVDELSPKIDIDVAVRVGA